MQNGFVGKHIKWRAIALERGIYAASTSNCKSALKRRERRAPFPLRSGKICVHGCSFVVKDQSRSRTG
jgi:hypothetical protein